MSTETGLETELRTRLTRIAETTAPPADPGLATRIAARARARRRQRLGLTALAAAVAAVVVAVPVALPGTAPAPVDGKDAPAGPASPGATVDVLAGPTRGPLAGDTAFLEGVRQLPWTGSNAGSGVPDPDVSTRRVVWAGDVAGARWALVAAENTARPEGEAADPGRQTDLGALSGVATAWFAGPPGADAAQMTLVTLPRGVDPGQPLGLVDSTTGAMAVVALRGDAIEVSRRPEIGADAVVTRSWEPVEAVEGVAVAALPTDGTATLPALRFRVLRDGAVVADGGPETTASSEPAAQVPVEWLRGRPGSALAGAAGQVPNHAQQVLWTLGLPAGDVRFAVAWAGELPAVDDRTAAVTVLTATLPSGAVYAQADLSVTSRDLTSGAGTWCGNDLRPAGPPVAEQTFVLRCDVTDLSADAEVLPTLVVVAPPEAAVARALSADGEDLGSYVLDGGVVVAAFPGGTAAVETRTADGDVLAETPVMGQVTWDG